MPRATVNLEDTETHNLKTAPPDGKVVLRRMSYGQIVQRRAMLKMSFSGDAKKGKDAVAGEIAMADEKITQFEFKTCIVDHNLEDDQGKKLNLASPVDFNRLDPRVGQEIEKLIGDMNNFNEEDEEGN
jgi:hypothetical protein